MNRKLNVSRTVVLCILLFLSVGLAGGIYVSKQFSTPPSTVPITTPTVNDVLIEYHRSGGFAGLDDTVTVRTNGMATVIRRTERRDVTIDRETMDRLRSLINSEDVSRLRSDYFPSQGADYFEYELTFNNKTIRTADTVIPPPLQPVIELLNDIIVSDNAVSPNYSPTATSVIDSTANWKTYKNIRYGFEAKYPSNWYVFDLRSDFVRFEEISNKGGTRAQFIIEPYDYNSDSAKKVLSLQIGQSMDIGESRFFKRIQDIRIDGQWVYQYNLYECYKSDPSCLNESSIKEVTLYVYFKAKEHYYRSNYYRIIVYDDKLRDNHKLFYQILSTFRLLDQNQTVDISNWRAYTNDQLKISFQYPNDWIIQLDDKEYISYLCDLNSIIPTLAPIASVRFGSCNATGVTPTASITLRNLLHIRPESAALQESYAPNSAIKLFYYENPEDLTIQEFNNKYLSHPVAGDPVSIWSKDYEEVTNPNGIKAYYDKEHYCVARCQIYVWAYDKKIVILKNFPTNAKNQNEIFHQIFSTLKFLDQN